MGATRAHCILAVASDDIVPDLRPRPSRLTSYGYDTRTVTGLPLLQGRRA